MIYLYERGRYKLFEIEAADEKTPGITGLKYPWKTVLLFESHESEPVIGREVAWANDEHVARELADELADGTKRIAMNVQLKLAANAAADTALAKKRPKAPRPANGSNACAREDAPRVTISKIPPEQAHPSPKRTRP